MIEEYCKWKMGNENEKWEWEMWLRNVTENENEKWELSYKLTKKYCF